MTQPSRPLLAHAAPDGAAVLDETGLIDYMSVPGLVALASAGEVPVRMLGDRINVGVVVALADAGVDVELGRPDVTRWTSVVACGEVSVLYEMAQCLGDMHAASVGGWRIAGPPVLTAYRLAAVPRGVSREVLLSRHPAAIYLDYVRGVDREAAADFFATVLDPRYFASSSHPDRIGTSVVRYLGLRRRASPPGSVRTRADSTANLWSPAGADPGDPRWFPCRASGGGEGHFPGIRLLVRYLIAGWLNSLASPESYEEQVFVPEEFWSSPDEVAAFRAYIRGRFARRGS